MTASHTYPNFTEGRPNALAPLLTDNFTEDKNCYNEALQKQFMQNKKLVTEFVHGNDNFTRKGVLDIQEHANRCLIEPLLNMFLYFAKCNFEQNDTLLNAFVQPVLQAGNLIYHEKVKAALMSVKFPIKKYFETKQLLIPTLEHIRSLQRQKNFYQFRARVAME